jgi:hypothetical protein
MAPYTYYPHTLGHFLDRKDAVYALVDEVNAFDARTRRSVISYLDTFYDDITQPETIATKFIQMCIPVASEEYPDG